MFQVQVGEKEYRVQFQHARQFFDRGGLTRCVIENGEKKVSVGLSFCNPVDNFNKNTGRKLALTRALQLFDRETRALFWMKYYQARGNKW